MMTGGGTAGGRLRRVVAVAMAAAALSAVLAGPGRAAPTDVLSGGPAPFIQPGEFLQTETSPCSLAFVFDGEGAYEGDVFVLTAAHCVTSGVGEKAWLSDGTPFGTAAFVRDPNTSYLDYAFIKVAPEFEFRVAAGVKGHPAYPTGTSLAGRTAAGDSVHVSGYALGASALGRTREGRAGVLKDDAADRYEVIGPIWWGDSGGPLVHVPTGEALGVVSRLCGVSQGCTARGATVEGILADAAAHGFRVRLRTAGSTPPA